MNCTKQGLNETIFTRTHFVLAMFLALAAIIPFIESTNWDFVWDDHLLIRNNQELESPDHVEKIWLSDFFQQTSTPAVSHFWRPLVKFSFWVDYKLNDREPSGYHVTNLFLFYLLGATIFFFFLRYVGTPAAVLGTLLFTWHPLRTEVVTWISCRTELMVMLFGLLAIILFQQSFYPGKKRYLYLLGAIVSLALSLASKESAILIPVFAALLSLKQLKHNKIFFILFTLPVGAWFILRKYAVGYERWFPSETSLWLKPAAALRSLAHYTSIHLWPTELSSEPWFHLPTSYFEIGVLAGLVVLVVLACIIFYQRNTAGIGAIWYLLALTPFLHVLPLPERAADRYTTMASVGFCLIIIVLVDRLFQKQKTSSLAWGVWALLLVVAFGGAVISYQYSPSWLNDPAIEIRAAKFGGSPQALFYRGMQARVNKDIQGAYEAYTLALKRSDSPSAILLYELALTELELNMIHSAVTHLEQTLKLSPTHNMAGIMLGELYMRKGDYQKALNMMRDQARRFPRNPVPHIVQAQIYMDFLNDPTQAKSALEEAQKKNLIPLQRQFVINRLKMLKQDPESSPEDNNAL